MPFAGFIDDCERNEYVNITHAIVCSRDFILKKYVKYPYKMDSLKLFFSMTKSFSSLAIGIASDLGLLDIEDCITKYFEDELPQVSDKNLGKISIRHLLTMSSGIHDNTYDELIGRKSWIKAFLSQSFPHEPGTYYRYSTHGSHMLSAIITKVTGISLEDFLNQYLFHPMDIYEAQWERSPEGLIAGGMGLSLYPMSLVKVAQMLLNKGVYNGKRIISEEYLTLATSQQILKQDELDNPEKYYSGAGYGFQFHVGADDYYRMDGAFGQICLICPIKGQAVVVFSQKSKTEDLLKLIYMHLLDDTYVNNDFERQEEHIESKSSVNTILPCGKYHLESNPQGIKSLEFIADEESGELRISRADKVDRICFSLEKVVEGQMYFIKDQQEHLQEYVCTAKYEDELELTVYLIETPYVATYRFRFDEDEVQFGFSINVSFTLKDFVVKGRLRR